MIDAVGALIVLIILFARKKNKGGVSPQTRLFHALLCCCLAVFLTDIPGLLLDGAAFPGARGLLWFVDTAYWALHALYCWLWTLFSDEWVFRRPKNRARRALLYALPMLVGFAILSANPRTGWLFALDANNAYAPGTAYRLCLVPLYAYAAISMAIAACGSIAGGDPDRRRRCLSLMAYMILPICGAVMELLAYGVSWLWPMNALSLLLLYLGMQQQVLSDERLSTARAAETAARMEIEMTNSRMAIMLSQIQPHFLYNALCVIQDLCHDKAPEAERATVAFSRFLRANLDSLRADRPVPFEQELDHTRYYLTLEQMRFGVRLRVEYDLHAEMFRLPAMTLQPIVENAVRYGVRKKEICGTVRISSMETATRYIVTVEDDGPGFDPNRKHADGRTHIGIDNVRQRLREMCGGELRIRSTPGVGTVASIVIPKGGDLHANSGG